MPRVAFHTLGCKVNQGETAAMTHLFRQAGYDVTDFTDQADVYVINTCAVTVQAERKSRQMIRRAREHDPGAMLVIVGCYPQVAGKKLADLLDIDLIVGNTDKHHVVELVERARQTASPLVAVSRWSEQTEFDMIATGQENGRTRATVKIQDGCQQFCSYCIIPYARGPERSRSPLTVLSEARSLIASSFQELVLTGIHLGSYGRNLQPQASLAQLLEEMLSLTGLVRLRLSSIEPNEITPDLLQLMRDHDNFCRHLHIPLQAGEDRVLKMMNRRYTTADYRRIIAQVWSYVPEIAITTDVIVGFPGETAAEFNATCEFVQEIGFSRLHVFRYSRRPGTPAAELKDQVPTERKEERSRILIGLGQKLAVEYASQLLGQEILVLWEHEQRGLWTGHTDTYVQVSTRSPLRISNQLLPARVTRLAKEGVFAELLPKSEDNG